MAFSAERQRRRWKPVAGTAHTNAEARMRKIGNVLFAVGIVTVGVGFLGLLSHLLQWAGVSFRFVVAPWYGPLLGGMLLAVAGWMLRRQSAGPAPPAA